MTMDSSYVQYGRPSQGRMSEVAYDRLKEDIDSGKLTGGMVIKEAEFVDRFEMSRTPVREALQRLITEGYVEQLPRGFAIIQMSEETVANIYRVRGQLEGMAARLAVGTATRIDVARMQDIHDQERRLAEGESTASERGNLSDAFHDSLSAASQNHFLQSILDLARRKAAPYRARLLRTNGVRNQVVDDHQAIIDAIMAGDASGAEYAARVHARRTVLALLGQPASDEDLQLDANVMDMIRRLDQPSTQA